MATKRKLLDHMKQRLSRQSTWSTIAASAAGAAALFPVYANPLGAVAILAALVKPFLVEDSTYTPESSPTQPEEDK